MTLYVMVLYTDLSIQTESYADIGKLPKENVLCISLTTEVGNRQALVAREWGRHPREKEGVEGEWWGTDNYAIVELDSDSFFTEQWDDADDEWRVHDFTLPHGSRKVTRTTSRFPTGVTIHLFRGSYISPDEWIIALAKFEAELF